MYAIYELCALSKQPFDRIHIMCKSSEIGDKIGGFSMKAPTFWPLREAKLPLSGTVEQKNSIQTMTSKKESLRSHVCQPRLRLHRQLHVIWDISYFTGFIS